MSKKLVCIRVFIVVICLIVVSLFVFMINSIHKSVYIKETVTEETKEERIEFDMTLPPSKQKNLRGHIYEYLSQVCDYLYKDVKWKNVQEVGGFDYSDLKQMKDRDKFYRILQFSRYGKLFSVLFNSDNQDIFKMIYLSYPLNLDDVPVTENYKEKHKEPLYKEFSFIKKEDYKNDKKFYNEYMDFDYWYEFIYDYGVGVNEDNKEVIVTENKSAALVYKERETGKEGVGIVRDKDDNEAPAYIETRKMYFTYTLDEKGYVDDIKYDRTEVIIDDKYLDNLIKYE